MAKETFYTATDLGTNKVCTIIAKIGTEGDLKVLGTGIVPSQGIQKGQVESMGEAQEAVKASVQEAQRYLGRGVSWAYLSVTGSHISCINTTGSLSGSRANGGAISPLDVQQLIRSSYPDVGKGKEVLHVIPTTYVVDGLTGVRNPTGLHAESVQVESHVVLGDAPILKNLVKVVESCKLSVRCLVLQPLAAAEAVLTEDEREVGVVLVDIGGGTSDVIIYRAGNPWYTSVIPVGGNQLTRDLSVALGIPSYLAEELKVKHGASLPEDGPLDEEVQLPGFQGQPKRMVKRRAMVYPLNERLTEIIKLVLSKVRKAGLRHMPTGGMVITGGTSEIPGLQELARKATAGPVRVAYPTGILGLPSELRKPAYSAAVGTLLWGIKHQGEKRPYTNGKKTLRGPRHFPQPFRRTKEKVAS